MEKLRQILMDIQASRPDPKFGVANCPQKHRYDFPASRFPLIASLESSSDFVPTDPVDSSFVRR